MPNETFLVNRLWRAFLPRTADDLIAPISPKHSLELLSRLDPLSERHDVATAIARLVLEVRAGTDAKLFLKSLRTAVDAANQESMISMHQLRGLDSAAFFGAGRYELSREVLELREALIEKIYTWANSASATPKFQRTAASWMLSSAELGFRLGKPIEWCQPLHAQAESWLQNSQQGSLGGVESELSWLRARAFRLAASLTMNPDERIKYLLVAVTSAEQALVHGGRKINQARFYLRMVRNLLAELPQDEQRRHATTTAIETMGKIFGSKCDEWPLEVHAQLSAVMRYEAMQVNNPQVRIGQLRQAVEFLKPAKSRAVSLAKKGDSRSLLTLARLYRGLGREQAQQGQFQTAQHALDEARRLGELASNHASSTATWNFLLELEDFRFGTSPNFGWDYDSVKRVPLRVSDGTKDLIKRCRHWLNGIETPGIAEGRVALQCLQCEWHAQGNLMLACSEEAMSRGDDWQMLKKEDKRIALRRQFSKRIVKLQKIQKKFGDFSDAALAHIHLESQLQYSLALVNGDGTVDTGNVASLFRQAADRLPSSMSLDLERARFYRRIWSYEEAINGFIIVAERSRDAADRRSAAVELIEALVSASLYSECVQLSNEVRLDKPALVSRAHEWLIRLFNFPDVANDVAVLRDQIQLELG